jgi:hypothetical protein
MSEVQQSTDDGGGIDRRGFLKRAGAGTAAAGMTVYGGNKVLYETVGQHRGTAKALVPALIAGGVAVAAVAGAVKLGYDAIEAIEEGNYSAEQLHIQLYNQALAIEDGLEKEQSFENLVAENADNIVWEEGLYQYAQCYNSVDSDKTAGDCRTLWKDVMRDKGADYEQQIVANLNKDISSLAFMAQSIHNYEYVEELKDIVTMSFDWDGGISSAGTETFDVWNKDSECQFDLVTDSYSATEVREILDPFTADVTGYDGTPHFDKITETETYDALGGNQVSLYPSYHPNVSVLNPDTGSIDGNLYIEGEKLTISGDNTSFEGIVGFGVKGYDSGASKIDGILSLNRRSQALQTIQSNILDLVNQVDPFADETETRYDRGDLPIEDIVSPFKLAEEWGYEEGNAALTNMYYSKLTGKNANISTFMKVKHYNSEQPSGDGWSEEDEGTVLEGYISTDNADVTYTKGEVIEPSSFEHGFTFTIQSSGNVTKLDNPFKIQEITTFDEDGNPENVDEAGQENYTFDPRSPSEWEDEYENTSDAEEEATNNPDADSFDFGGGNVLPDGIPEEALAIPVIGTVILVVLALLR